MLIAARCLHAGGRASCWRPRNLADLGTVMAPSAEDGSRSVSSDGSEIVARSAFARDGGGTLAAGRWPYVRRGRGARLATARCSAFEAPLRPGEARAGAASRAYPIAWLEARPSIALARTSCSRAAAVRPEASAAMTAAPPRITRSIPSSSVAHRRPGSRTLIAAAAAEAVA